MPESSPLAAKIDALNALAEQADVSIVERDLRKALSDRSSQVVAKAAAVSSQLRFEGLEAALQIAFDRSFINPLKRDPGCVAKTAIAEALLQLDSQDVEPFRRGIRYRQFEPVWGGQEDTAALLRAVCAAGMVSCAPRMEAITCFADLLADPCRPAREGAARAIAGLGSWEGVPLLRLKILSGDDDPEVLGECCSALLELAIDENIELVVGLLTSKVTDVRVRAAIALGESHSAKAFEPLCACWEAEREPAARGLLLTCLGLLRSHESRRFLISLITGTDSSAASDAIRALAPFAMIEGLREQAGAAVAESGSERLRAVFEEAFDGGY